MICNTLQIVYIIFFVALSILFMHIQVDKEFYRDKMVTIEKSNIHYSSTSKNDANENNSFKLNQMTTSSLYINYLRYSGLLIVLFLSTREFKNIIKSVQHLKTFRDYNVQSCRKIGKLVFIYFILSSFYSYQFNEVSYSGFSMSFTPLIIALLAFIMAEIFKEGNVLLEDKELTI